MSILGFLNADYDVLMPLEQIAKSDVSSDAVDSVIWILKVGV